MTTSLPPDAAIFNVRVSVFQRSAGRSAVAAAAYRSASRLTDERIGETFDYTKKKAEDSFILAPAGAPAWAYDRAELWNRVEAAERRKDAVVAREVLITIPRDIPEEDRRAFIEEAVAPYVAAGAVVDVAYHCPPAVDGGEQPHFHVMLATRRLDESQPSGFAKTRNPTLTAMFESGGRHGGGERGTALTAERERIARSMNGFLARAGSTRRVDHRSNADRGLHREPEPKIGEQRARKMWRQKSHDRRTRLVQSTRATRIAEMELTATEESIMETNPAYQARNGIKMRHRQDYKKSLLLKRVPDARGIDQEKLYMIDVKNPAVTKIQTRDGGWVELDHRNRTLKTYGERGYADEVAQAIYAADYADDVERLEELKTLQRKGSGIRQRRPRREPGQPVEELPQSKIESIADRWRSRGYHKITEAVDGVFIEIGKCRLQDTGDELRIHGPAASDAAVRAMVEKVAAEWGSEVEVYGNKEFKDALWLEAQRQGVKVFDQTTGEEYQPSEELRRRFNADRARVAEEGNEIAELKRRKAMASLLLEAAAGDTAALTKLKANDQDLADFITLHLDDEGRGQIVGDPEASIVPSLAGFRALGKAAREADEAKKREDGNAPGHPLDFDASAQPSPDDGLRMADDDQTDEPEDFTRRPK